MPKTSHDKEVRRTPKRMLALLAVCALLSVSPFMASAKASKKNQARPAAQKGKAVARPSVPAEILLQIIEAEDERRWDESDLGVRLKDANAGVRRRAALAAGRIGDEGAVAPLSTLLRADADAGVREMAAFALGEIEAESGAEVLLDALARSKTQDVRARSIEALGKIAAALPEARADAKKRLGEAITTTLAAEGRLAKPSRAVILFGLTAVLRARPEQGARTVATFLSSSDARVREDAANTLARLRAKESLERLRAMLTNDTNAVARANAARALGAAEDAASFVELLERSAADTDARVRVSAIRALAQLKNARAAELLIKRGEELFTAYRASRASATANPAEVNELLEITTALGRVLPNANDERAIAFLRRLREAGIVAPEVETALARVAPAQYMRDRAVTDFISRVASVKDPNVTWQKVSATGQGLGEMASVTSAMVGNSVVNLQADAQLALRSLVESKNTPALAVPDLLRALAAFKPLDLAAIARAQLKADDTLVRATAADILSELPPDAENSRALAAALPRALQDEINDAALSMLGALAKQTGAEVMAAVEKALEVTDYLVRRRAADILHERAGGVTAPPQESQLVKRSVSRDGLVKALQLDGLSVEELSNLIKLRGVAFKVTPEVEAELREAGATPELIATARASYRDTSLERRVETVNTRNHREDYERAAARAGKNVRAVVSTDKGALTIELLAEDAPLTVDNFVQLARRNYFNGITFHRVVPNFVIQGGDPRGDGNGGPGYQIRCEINMAPYGRGAVGMALSGKDTGGSQWFVTHSPQPHLDGGYTVFGRVVEGLEVVDRIARGDRIRGIQIIESKMNRK